MISQIILFQNGNLCLIYNDIEANAIENSFNKVYVSAISTRIRRFQYRPIHMIMGNNAKFYRYGIKDRENFTYLLNVASLTSFGLMLNSG